MKLLLPQSTFLYISLTDHKFPNFPAHLLKYLYFLWHLTSLEFPICWPFTFQPLSVFTSLPFQHGFCDPSFQSPLICPLISCFCPVIVLGLTKSFFFLHCHLSSCTQQLSTREKNTKNNWYYCKFTFMTFNWSQYYLEILQWFFFHEPILYNDVFKPPFSSNLCSLYPQFFGGKLCLLFIKEVDPICGSSFGFSRITNLLSCTHLLCLPSYCNGQIPLLSWKPIPRCMLWVPFLPAFCMSSFFVFPTS